MYAFKQTFLWRVSKYLCTNMRRCFLHVSPCCQRDRCSVSVFRWSYRGNRVESDSTCVLEHVTAGVARQDAVSARVMQSYNWYVRGSRRVTTVFPACCCSSTPTTHVAATACWGHLPGVRFETAVVRTASSFCFVFQQSKECPRAFLARLTYFIPFVRWSLPACLM